MSVFDVQQEETIDIIFSEKYVNDTSVAYKIQKSLAGFEGTVEICDVERVSRGAENGYVLLERKEDAFNLIKALEKAIALGWLK